MVGVQFPALLPSLYKNRSLVPIPSSLFYMSGAFY